MNINPLKPIAVLLEQLLREQVAIRQGLQLLLGVHGVSQDLKQLAEDELAQLREMLAPAHKPYGPGDILGTSDERSAADEILAALGDDTEKMILELEAQGSGDVAAQIRGLIAQRQGDGPSQRGHESWERSGYGGER
jgi:hypothetical protein